jgi:hypothetical protein
MAANVAVATEDRPPRLVFVYTWDVIKSVGALVAALAAFAGGVDINGKAVPLPLWEQVVGGVSYTAYAGALIVAAVLLARREMWVRREQLVLLILSAVLIVTSIFPAASGASLAWLLVGAGAFLALDFAAIWSLTRADAKRWYVVPGKTPKYMTACVVLWIVGSVITQIVEGIH